VRLRALAPVVLALTLAACLVAGATVLELASFATTQMPLATNDLSATPTGWVPVAYGDAQVSVPATWYVLIHAWCGGTWPPIIQLGVVVQDLGCSTAPPPPTVSITPVGSIPAPYRQEKPARLNGISVLLGPNSLTFISYFVPSLHVEVWASGAMGKRVIETLAVAPRVTVLASGPARAIPSSWEPVSFAGLRFSVPAGWPVQRTTTWNLCGPVQIAVAEGVVLDTDQRFLALPCAAPLPYPIVPSNGVRVDTGGSQSLKELIGAFSPGGPCLRRDGLTMCPSSTPAYSILVLRVTVPGRSKPVYVSIGLAGNGMVARTILYSLRAA
jgi:hypothetical protein